MNQLRVAIKLQDGQAVEVECNWGDIVVGFEHLTIDLLNPVSFILSDIKEIIVKAL